MTHPKRNAFEPRDDDGHGAAQQWMYGQRQQQQFFVRLDE
eukprot:CAMPEP_0113467778 /NCGR_PEP_ID=MMETSP0014_2-20120614/14997_1 /TAXON_ID=2857 /ORGANISM="Nitzschia sp." /LENGTH=39 /DNA_ID=CAMNT_0000360111 /DNA_START=114 /DNA_END=233 /DNA_ORIENTATION=+ /assembly_acc=CAM_ASM_000159